ncbi:imidazoleglycerol-phosphate dehydratase HisB [Paramaledivibacter caminithermalis]|jgi:imidazoleglycerol-phosphate dehydratase|uniref:Imidazoleglycerol-phosphate dehydratase n=1 Tax=Paramaledivibacter caminithermalis (strain DSM 15212 / CIP 107654 / DViRD3) TaxID=1121301 RepID=A0A1M6K9D0_PARC5|nr:imidazoleglycerol-phosphate dehydratase HisB [Paramaledivibacter caminithermalis]SHJ55578.1 imidazoleglycerol-phosphate dehydratase [Paramaledivibacter caminithermalis DSM 15212]
MIRIAEITRKTTETDITLKLDLDGSGKAKIDTGIGFLDHMLNLMSKHGQLNLEVKCKGDLEVDTHHTVEDLGIVLGKAIKKALGNKSGIKRYSTVFTPMDEALSMLSIDISGRSFLKFNVPLTREYIGDFETETLREFFIALTNNSNITLHINLQYGENNHHIIESIFKGFGRALKEAVTIDKNIEGVMSTKGIL